MKRWVRRLLRGGGYVAAALALLAWPAAFAVDRWMGTDAVLFHPHPPEEVDTQRVLWQADGALAKDEEVVGIYGTPFGRDRVIGADAARVVRPAERPELVLYAVDKSKNQNPLQARTVFYAAKWTAVAGAGAAILAFVALALLDRRRRPA